jgi:hypothetical protein
MITDANYRVTFDQITAHTEKLYQHTKVLWYMEYDAQYIPHMRARVGVQSWVGHRPSSEQNANMAGCLLLCTVHINLNYFSLHRLEIDLRTILVYLVRLCWSLHRRTVCMRTLAFKDWPTSIEKWNPQTWMCGYTRFLAHLHKARHMFYA